jgi:O-antigen ligase
VVSLITPVNNRYIFSRALTTSWWISGRQFGSTFAAKGGKICVNILEMNSSRIAENIIEYTFYILIFFVPLVWLPVTSELFEFNKMILVYFGASVVLTAWLFKSVNDGAFTLKRTSLDIPILLFLAANIAATVFSIDRHSSIFGVYSRFNGGLLSTISYIILYFAFVTFFDREKLFRLLKILLLSAGVVAIYAILQHPTPLFRTSEGSFRGIDAGYWQQNAEKRAFSTLGHPNWLAAFMAMVIPIGFFFLVALKRLWEKALITVLLTAYFLAFTFAYSRGGTVGLVGAILVVIVGAALAFHKQLSALIRRKRVRSILSYFRPQRSGFFILLVIVCWAATVFFFSNAFLSRGVNFASIGAEDETQLARLGNETGKIRLIVWKGAYDIFKNSAIVGSGVETFAFSYYQFRPTEHNLTGEWDFLYNKAHNEFVNYLATTGGLGFATYVILIGAFVIILLMYLSQKGELWQKYFAVCLVAGYTGYHAQNLFGFSVVPIALLFYLLPAFFFVGLISNQEVKIPLTFFKGSVFSRLAKVVIVFIGIFLFWGVSIMWLADYYYNLGIGTSNYEEGYQNLKVASSLRPDEPLYKANLGVVTMYLATNIKDEKKQNERIAESFAYLNSATTTSPANISLWRLRLEAIYELAAGRPEYKPQVAKTAEIVGELAPTEAQIQYELASIYVFADDYKQAQAQLEKVVDLKFNYEEAWQLLFQVDDALEDKKATMKHYEKLKEFYPKKMDDPEFQQDFGLSDLKLN